jgi:hypothetical protein
MAVLIGKVNLFMPGSLIDLVVEKTGRLKEKEGIVTLNKVVVEYFKN